MAVKPIPEGFHTVTPYLLAAGVPKLIDFLKGAFGGEVIEYMATPDGTVMHAEVKIGDSIIMLSDPRGQCQPELSSFYLYVPDVDAVYHQALQAGGTSITEPADQFYGDRSGGVKDPVGNSWWIATHIEDVSPEELRRRVAAQAEEPA